MSLLAYALVDPSEFSLPASVTSGEKELMINAATLAIEKYTGRAFVTRTVTNEEQGVGPNGYKYGFKTLTLNWLPITAVASVIDDASITVPANDYAIWKYRGLEHVGHWPAPLGQYGDNGKYKVTYSAGEYANTAAVPADVKQAAIGYVKLLAAGAAGASGAVQSKTVGNLSITYATAADAGAGGLFPAGIRSILDGYRIYRT